MSTEIRGRDSITNAVDPVKVSGNNLHVAQYVWDVNTLSWIKQTGTSGGAGTDVNVTNFPSTQTITGSVTLPSYAKRYEQVSDTLAYLGNAVVGSAESSGVWQIQKLVFTAAGDVTITWANGSTAFNNAWTSRASLSYT